MHRCFQPQTRDQTILSECDDEVSAECSGVSIELLRLNPEKPRAPVSQRSVRHFINQGQMKPETS
jgi:hypothetical protein